MNRSYKSKTDFLILYAESGAINDSHMQIS